MAHNYPKIYAPFKRTGPKDKFVNMEIWQRPEFQYLSKLDWVWTEKIDGTSIGIQWDGERVSLIGHTDKSQIPPILKTFLEKTFLTKEAESIFESEFGEKPITFYGEGLSKETNHNYGFIDGAFIMYDVYNPISNSFWDREAVAKYASLFGLKQPEVVYIGPIEGAVAYIRSNPNSRLDPSLKMEGIVGRPKTELKMNNGDRVICKVKACDYEPLNN